MMVENYFRSAETIENNNPENSKQSEYDPDKRVESGNVHEKDAVEGTYDPDERLNVSEIKPDENGYFTKLEDRVKRTNLDSSEGGLRGSWDGERGDSMFRPSYLFIKDALEKYGQEGINYRNGEADFSKVTEATVKIENMTSERLGIGKNFDQANTKLAEQFNIEQKDGRYDWTARDVDDWRIKNKLSWHERCDCETMDLVPTKIHDYFRHSGGVAECNIRDGVRGGFDE